MQTDVATTPALKEWSAVVHALLDGRQTVLLRKGGIGEKAFSVPREMDPRIASDRFVLFPTVAHSHAERVRPEHHDLLARGAADIDEAGATFVVRCGVTLAGVVEVTRPDALPAIGDLHIWTDGSVQSDRVDFRPKKALQILVVRAFELPEPVRLRRLDAYGGCVSWLDLPMSWSPAGRQIHSEERLAADVERVRDAVG